MSVNELNHQAKVTYLSNRTNSRTLIEIKDDNPLHSSHQTTSNAHKTVAEFINFSSSSSTTVNSVNEQSELVDTYQRPISPDVFRNKILVEAMFEIELGDGSEELAQTINKLQLSQASSSMDNITGQRQLRIEDLPNQNSSTITFGNQTFSAGSDVKTVDITVNSQNLNFFSSGVYSINDKEFHSTFELVLSEERISITESTAPAQVLKDPLLVQFGPRSLGHLSGKSSEIDINNDDIPDSLPMFEGDVGYLVFDKNSNDKADGGHELFGPQSGDGFSDLSVLDSNNNGFIDREDDDFSQLKILQIDEDGNEKLKLLSDTDIEAISLNSTATPFNFYDKNDQLQAKLTQSSVALTNTGISYGVHQVDVKI